MLFKDEFIVEAPLDETWSFLSHFPGPIALLPGLTQLRETAFNSYMGSIKVGIGPLAFHFQGDMSIVLIDPIAYRVNISGKAHDPKLGGHFNAVAYTQIVPHGPKQSRILLKVEVGLGGLLGKLGLFVLRPVAHRVTQLYGQLVTRELETRRNRVTKASDGPSLSVSTS